MKSFVMATALAAIVVAAPATAQRMGGAPRAGQTRDQAMAAAAKAFGRLDTNSDGSIDTAEVTAAMQARATASGKPFKAKQVTRMISRNDANTDGKVTLDEFKAAAGTQFDAHDTNKNGTIDADEAGTAAAPAAGGGEE